MELKNALHINSYFLSNKIHHNFYKTITRHRQDKFLIPVYKEFRKDHIDEVSVDYVFTGIDKQLFFTKFFKIFYLIYKKGLTSGYDYIHAHTLISDGIAAYMLSRITNKKFVVTVRSTDVGYFIKKSSVFQHIAKKILSKASMVFFVSPSYKEIIKKLYPKLDHTKFYMLPNGIDDFWIENASEKTIADKEFKTLNILFVGQIIKRKKLDLLIDFVKKYDDRKYNLTIVGKNTLNLDFDEIAKGVKHGNTINYLGEIKDRNELLKIYRSNDIFALISYAETFGVVYIEALTQGLPIIYKRDDGVFGYFEEGQVGCSCDHRSLEELKEKVETIVSDYDTITNNTTKTIRNFEWEHLVKQYLANVNAAL